MKKQKTKNSLSQYVAYNLSWRVMYWVLIRLWAYASTTAELSHKGADQITWSEVISAWNGKKG